MNTSVRARHDARGFSFIELLVTIIIAAVAFLAMVPMFVSASKASANDKSRVVALNIAQDRIEKVRRLDFASLTNATLNVNDSASPFATTQYEQTQSGQKPFTVACQVQDLQVSATDTRVVSRKVTVTVSWSTPSPGGSVSISTIVYRQYAGPQIMNFTVAPYDPAKDWISAANVTLKVTVNPAEVASMRPVTVGSRTLRGYVLITISPIDGSAVLPAITVPYTDASPTTFAASWAVPNGAGFGDGYYKFTAVAYTANKSPGNTWSFSKRVETGRPGPVSNLSGTASETQAVLTWSPSVSADVADYEVTRTDPTGTTTVIIAGDPTKRPLWQGTGWTDTTALVLHQTYVYTVTAYDQAGIPSDTKSVSLYVWSASELGGPPLPATDLKGDPSANFASLSWTASASPLVLGYQVYAMGDPTTPVMTVNTPYAAVPQAWNTTAWYQVKPYRTGGLLSTSWASILSPYPVELVGGVQWVHVTTQVQTLYTFNIVNDASASNKKADISLWYLGPTGQSTATQVGTTQTQIKNGDAATWTGQPYGQYRWSWVTTDNPSLAGQREESFAVGTGGTVSVFRHCIVVP